MAPDPPTGPRARVRRLFVHPVKSMAGIEVDHTEVDRLGPRHDRRWVVVDPRGGFLTQRERPRLALVRTAIEGDRLVLKAPAGDPLVLPLEPPEGAAARATVWGDEVLGVDAGGDAARWLAALLGAPARLVGLPPRIDRKAKRDPSGAARIGFADAAPFLVVGAESVAELVRRAGTDLEVERFRPNVVVGGAGPFAEDRWLRFEMGAIPFLGAGGCSRCSIPTIDPRTGRRGQEPLKTLATFRRREDGRVYFGVNAVHEATGELAVGDPVEVVEAAPADAPALP